ncbi:MAG: hypothetical protein AB1458_10230 [Bacteroidota bacterium]
MGFNRLSAWGAFTGLPAVFIALSGCSAPAEEPQADLTFSGNIAQVIFTNCTPCHRKDGTAPFSLQSYQDVKRKAASIKYVVSTRFMPPWPADPNYSHFAGEKVLSREQIGMIVQWVEKGCPVGDSTRIPPVPRYPEGSMLGKPDMVVRMMEPVFLKGDGMDRFLLMKLPYEIGHDTFVRAIEFVPDKKKLVHHVNGFLLQYDEGSKKNVFTGKAYVDTRDTDYKAAYELMQLSNDDGLTYPMLTPSAVNYLPGVLPVIYPEGIGGLKVKSKGAIFLKDIHYGPSASDQYDSSYFNVFFGKEPTGNRPLLELQLGTLSKVAVSDPPLVIPPDSVKTFRIRFKVPEDISVVTINPHMHLLGKSFWAFAVKPGGDTIPLIRIPRWDFRWQYFYTFKKMLKIPAGSVIHVVGVYDNTKNNPLNPFNPPRAVGERDGSMRTTDEMFQFIINYLPYKPGDENISLEN